MRARTLSCLLLFTLAALPVVAQTIDTEALPPVLAIEREEIKPGKMMAHGRSSAAVQAVLAKVDPEGYWLGLTPISGDSNVIMYLQGFPSFAALEASMRRVDEAMTTNVSVKAEMERLAPQSAEVHQSQRTAYWDYRKDLSYRSSKMSDIAKSRYMTITSFRVKPGRIPDYVDYLKTLNAAFDKAGASWVSRAVYQSRSGAPAGTFLVFNAVRSLAEWDESSAKGDERQKAIEAAIGGEQVVKMRRELVSEILIEPPTSITYQMSRSDSRPSPQFAAADPDFWTPKPAAAKALAVKKGTPEAPNKQ